MYKGGVMFARQDSHVWDSIFRIPFLCFLLSSLLLSRSQHSAQWKNQNSIFVSIVYSWIMWFI